VIAYKFITGTGTPALLPLGVVGFIGACASNLETTTVIFLKLWWQHDTATIPVIGTTAPDITIPIPSAGLPPFALPLSLNMGGGPVFAAVTKLGADTDTTALSTGGEVVTLFLN
jgi:hypothetical protein